MNEHRLVAGFAFAPLASALLQGLLMGNVGAGLFALVVAYPFTIIIGAPCFLICRKIGWLQTWQVILAGPLLGAISGLVLMLLIGRDDFSWPSVFGGIFFIALHGLVISCTFWAISIRGARSSSSLAL